MFLAEWQMNSDGVISDITVLRSNDIQAGLGHRVEQSSAGLAIHGNRVLEPGRCPGELFFFDGVFIRVDDEISVQGGGTVLAEFHVRERRVRENLKRKL